MRKIIWLVVTKIYVQKTISASLLYFTWEKKVSSCIYFNWKGITLAMECADVAAFTFATWQIRSSLVWKFLLPLEAVAYLFIILSLGNCSEFFGCFINASSEIQRKLTICWVYETEHARICSLYVTIREKTTTILKLAVDSVNFLITAQICVPLDLP